MAGRVVASSLARSVGRAGVWVWGFLMPRINTSAVEFRSVEFSNCVYFFFYVLLVVAWVKFRIESGAVMGTSGGSWQAGKKNKKNGRGRGRGRGRAEQGRGSSAGGRRGEWTSAAGSAARDAACTASKRARRAASPSPRPGEARRGLPCRPTLRLRVGGSWSENVCGRCAVLCFTC